MKVKIFNIGIDCTKKYMNKWFKKHNNISIKYIIQTGQDFTLNISVFYEKRI